MSEVSAQRGVPRIARMGRPPKWPFATMEVGDFFFSPRKTNTLGTTASMYARKLDRTFSTRMTWARKTSEGWELCRSDAAGARWGAGCWRIR